jgi:hypothetical protein
VGGCIFVLGASIVPLSTSFLLDFGTVPRSTFKPVLRGHLWDKEKVAS